MNIKLSFSYTDRSVSSRPVVKPSLPSGGVSNRASEPFIDSRTPTYIVLYIKSLFSILNRTQNIHNELNIGHKVQEVSNGTSTTRFQCELITKYAFES